MGKRIEGICEQSLQRLQSHHWLGNIRELENVIERAIIRVDTPEAVGREHIQAIS